MFTNNSPTNKPQKSFTRRLLGVCTIIALALALIATPAIAAGWGRRANSASTLGTGTYCTQNNCNAFIDENNDGICDYRNDASCQQNNTQNNNQTTPKHHWQDTSASRGMRGHRQHHNCW